MPDKVILRIQRREKPESDPYWEEFEVPYRANLNVHICLQEIRRHPVNREGKRVAPVAWEASCLEEVCGSCSMVINGRPRQACSTLVDAIGTTIEIRPLSKFAPVKDLVVDRKPMFDALKRLKAWIPIDGTYDLGPGPRMGAKEQQFAYQLSQCMTCGCCMEACPQYNARSEFLGPAPLSQVVLFNSHPTGKLNRHERLDAAMGPGGIQDCGKAQNCERVCPKNIPLAESLAKLFRETTLHGILGWLGK